MAIPSREKTFGLESCRDMLAKLEWEITRFKDARPDDVETLIYVAFNAAVTAWQLCEWVWADLGSEQRTDLGLPTLRALQDKARSESRAVHICRQIATASKHTQVTVAPDPNVETTTSATGVDAQADDEAINLIFAATWVLKVRDHGQTILAIDLFERALSYWTTFIYTNRVASDASLDPRED
jgi:hypothetical protein